MPLMYYILYNIIFITHGTYFISFTLCVNVGHHTKSEKDMKPSLISHVMLDILGVKSYIIREFLTSIVSRIASKTGAGFSLVVCI